MTCPTCKVYPIQTRARHGLCIKCGYKSRQAKIKEVNSKERKKILGKYVAYCPYCGVKFKKLYINQVSCTPDCKAKSRIISKNVRWCSTKKKIKTSLAVPSLIFKKNGNSKNKETDNVLD